MKLLPDNSISEKKLLVVLSVLLVISLVLFGVVFVRFHRLAVFPPCLNVASDPLNKRVPECLQITGDDGFEIIDGKVIAFPRCLTVMNSRFGSRFNFDWYFGSQTVRSGVLGNQKDADLGFQIWLETAGKADSIFPVRANSEFQTVKTEIGLTYQKIIFTGDGRELVMTITSPFVPSRRFEDEAVKLSAAPFFYLNFLWTGQASGDKPQETIVFSFNRVDDGDDPAVIYLKDGVRRDGRLAVAMVGESPVVQMDRVGNRGEIRWQTGPSVAGENGMNLIFAGYLEKGVMMDTRGERKKEMVFAYKQWFENIDEVIDYARKTFGKNVGIGVEKDFYDSPLSPREKWLAALAFHAYLGNGFLIQPSAKQNPAYLVWEGEFMLINTLDVAHDYAVLEGLYMPWVIRLALDSWREAARNDELGTVIPHDLGQEFNYSGQQAYGIPGHETSGMPVEENVNYLLLSWWYWRQSGDDRFLNDNQDFLYSLVESLKKRDKNGNGLADSVIRMTTYDNDGNSALKEAPDNSYLGVKQFAAYLTTAKMFAETGNDKGQATAVGEAELIVESLRAAVGKHGYLPLTLDENFTEKLVFNGRKIKGVEEQGFTFPVGLFYPVISGMKSPLFEEVKTILSRSFEQAYDKCLVNFPDGSIAGLQLTEYQSLGLGWFSHSVMAQVVAEKWLGKKVNVSDIWFPYLLDTPYGFADGQYFTKPLGVPKTTLIFYPRGAAIFGLWVGDGWKGFYRE